MSRLVALAVSFLLPTAAIAQAPSADDPIRADATGLVILAEDGKGARPLPFGTPFHETMFALIGLVGHDVHVAFPEECPAGPLVSVSLPGRIDVIFEQDRLAGWFVMDGDTVSTGDGIGVGTPRAALEDGRTTWLGDTGLGSEFERAGVYGILTEDGARVDFLWSGLACIFR
ncbi:hypothetical protein [Roseicyclus sp.]|uniref:hypothetical protein n=1 Tax=Roseicyclus sp. TaxID=1914329 RepID=UPI003FA16F7A